MFLLVIWSPKQFKFEESFEESWVKLRSHLPRVNPDCKEKKQRESAIKHILDDSRSSHFWSTFWSPIFTFYIPFQSSESQESNDLNHVWFGAEMRKIWTLEDNCIKLRDNFAHHCSRCEFLSPLCENFAHLKSTCEIGIPTCEFSPVSADSTRDLFF